MEISSFTQLQLDKKKSIVALIKDIIESTGSQWPVSIVSQQNLQLAEVLVHEKQLHELQELKERFVSITSYAYNHPDTSFKTGSTAAKTFFLNRLSGEAIKNYWASIAKSILL